MELMENHVDNMESIHLLQYSRCVSLTNNRIFVSSFSSSHTILPIHIKSNNSIDNDKAKYVCLCSKISSVVLRKKYENHNSLKVSLRIEMKINKMNFKNQSNFICIPATEIRKLYSCNANQSIQDNKSDNM